MEECNQRSLRNSMKTLLNTKFTVRKVSKYGVFTGPYFLAFELNTEIYFVDLRI